MNKVNQLRRIGKYLKTVAPAALGRTPAGRGLTVFPDHIFLVNYLRFSFQAPSSNAPDTVLAFDAQNRGPGPWMKILRRYAFPH